MANILGSLQVELSANTAKFVDGLSKAAYVAQQSAKNISREFSSLQRVASQTFSAFGSFGPQISQVTYALSQASRAASDAMKSFGAMGGSIGAIASISAGAGVALASVGVAAIGVAAHAAEGAAKLYELSQSTGVSTEALSGLGFAAKQAGVEQETLVKGLERMDKSAFAAATAPVGAVNAYTRLGVSVRDAGGQIRSTEAIFADLAEKFASMRDGVAKTALQIEIFGRGGAAMAPMLNLGKLGIDAMIASARQLGLVISGETGEAAHKFEQTLGFVGAAVDGLELSLMSDLLPSLQKIAAAMKDWLADPRNIDTLKSIAEFAASCARSLMNLADAFIFVGRAGAAFWQLTSGWTPFSPAKIKEFTASIREAYAEMQKFAQTAPQPDFSLASGFTAGEAFAARTHGGGGANAPAAGRLGPVSTIDAVGEAIGKLQAEASAQLALAGATDRSTAAMLFQKATGEAQVKVAQIRATLLSQEKSLEEQLANARANPTTAGGEEAAKIQARIAGVKKELASLAAATPEFTKLYAEIAAARASEATSQELDKKSLDFGRQIASLKELAAAYGSGRAAVAAAEIDKELEAEKQKVEDLRAEYARLQSVPGIGIVSKAQGQGPSPALAEMAAAVDAAAAKFAELQKQVEAKNFAVTQTEISKLSTELRGAAPLLEALNHAYLENEMAVRGAQVALELYRWTQAHPGATPDQIRAQGAAFKTQSDEAHASAIAQGAAQYDIGVAYANRIRDLEQMRELIQSVGHSTMEVDAAIYDEQRKLIEQWDQAAMKVGTFGEKMQAVLNQVAVDAQNAGAEIARSMLTAIGGIEDQLAKLIVTGKSNFKQVFQSFAESIVKIQIQQAAGGIAKAIGIKPPGKRGESAGNPLFVQVVGPGAHGAVGLFKEGDTGPSSTRPWSEELPGINPPSAGPADGIVGAIARLFGMKRGSVTTPPFLSPDLGNLPLGPGEGSGIGSGGLSSVMGAGGDSGGGGMLGGSLNGIFSKITASFTSIFSKLGGIFSKIFSGMGGGLGSLLGGFGKIFGGFLASGGDVTPGHAYIVGENRPELFVPRAAGTVMPSLNMGSGARQTTVNLHVHGVQDADSFRRSQAQIFSSLHAQMNLANARNG